MPDEPPSDDYSVITNDLLSPSAEIPGMCGLTTYNRVEGHFFLKRLPNPKGESVNRTVQGLADRFESSYEDTSVGSLVNTNDKVDVTQIVYQGEGLSTQTKSSIGTITATSGGAKTSAIIVQDGMSYYDGTSNQRSSGAATIVAIAVEDVKLFALKGLDIEQEALFDLTDAAKPTNEDYIRHLTPEKRSRVAIIDSPADLIASGGPPKVLVYYNAIDTSGEVIAGFKGSTFASLAGSNCGPANDIQAVNNAVQRGWLVVERTVPDANTNYLDTSGAIPNYRSLMDWLRLPYTTANANNTWTPLSIHAPGGLISIPTKDLQKSVKSHTLQVNPTGDITHSPFINIENCAHTIIQGSLRGLRDAHEGYGPSIAIPNTRSPITVSKSAYHTLSMSIQGQQQALTAGTYASHQPIAFEQFDIIDNIVEGDRHLLLVHPKTRSRSGSLSTLRTKADSSDDYHKCTIELMLMRGRVEEVTPSSDDALGGGLIIRGRSQLMDISDRTAQRDFNLSEGYPIKEIGDLGSPSVSLSLGGVGQGGIDIKPSRTEHAILPVWKDRVIGTGNPSVRNDKQTSTYYASTRALVELPLFPSMFFDVEKRLDTSENKRSPLPAEKSMELIFDCTMTSTNRQQMQNYENRWSIDWGLKGEVSSFAVHDFDAVKDKGWIRFMRENASSFLRQSAYSGVAETVVVGSLPATSYIEVDNVYPFLTEGGLILPIPSGTVWTFAASADNPDGTGFVVTVGEGIYSQRGVRLHIWKVEISGDSHRLYFSRFQDWDDATTSLANLTARFTVGMPVVMGCWLTDSNTAGEGAPAGPGAYPMTGLNANASTSAGNLAANFIGPMERALGLRSGVGTTRICIDPSDATGVTLLIKDGPTMEGFSFDPANYLYGNDDIPVQPPIECRTNHLALKGKRSNNTLDWVRPQRLRLGDTAAKGTVSKFKDAVNELIRQINQAGHPSAKNDGGGSAFNPPPLFTAAEGTYSVYSTDTGSHMGLIRAFLGDEVESRDGEKGLSIVIHSTIPGATGRNFAVWLHNRSPYPYRPIQAVGHGGLLATNSRSYQASSFPAPLPIGMDGETHLPITTFQGGIHGTVEDVEGNLRTYEGVGKEFEFTTVRNPIDVDGVGLPDYDPDTQPVLWVERKMLDVLRRIDRATTWGNEAIILVDDKHLGSFTHVAAGIGATFGRTSGTGACAALWHCYPLDRKLGKKWRDLFYDKNGNYKEVPIKLLYPLVDAHGILFFGGGHTGATFDVSDGTANDYSDFYTHHYAKGPTGYSGFQNLQEVQTSAAVLDFTQIKNADTVKDNTYRGLHHKQSVTTTGTVPAANHPLTQDCMAYVRMNHASLGATDHGVAGTELAAEALYGTKLKAFGNWSEALVAQASTAITVDAEARATYLLAANNHACLSMHKIEINGTNQVVPRVPMKPDMVGAVAPATTGNWSVSFLFHPGNVSAWSSEAYGNGPVLHGIDQNGRQWGVSLISKQGGTTSQIDFMVVAHASDAAGNDYITQTVAQAAPKDTWFHVVVSHTSGVGVPLIYVSGAVKGTTNTSSGTDHVVTGDVTYNAGGTAGQPHLPPDIGVGTLVSSGVLVNVTVAVGGTTIAVDTVSAISGVPPHFSIGSEVFTSAGVFLGIVDSINATTIGFKDPILTEAPNNDNLKKVTTLGTGMYGRAANMMTIGISLCSHGAFTLGSRYYGEPLGGASNNFNPIYFKGRLTEIALWNKALSAGEITTLYGSIGVWN